MPGSSDAATRLTAAERRARVVRLRIGGWSFEAIGEALDPPVSMQRAHQLYEDALRRIVAEHVDEHRQTDLARLDLLWRGVAPEAMQGSPRHVLAAVRVLERRAKMIGYDAPTKVEQHITIEEQTALDREIEQLLAERDRRALSDGRD
jgi:hypothetical protein